MKIYLITLTTAYRRKQSALAELNNQNIRFEVFYGINNNLLMLSNPHLRLSHGAIGCFISHLTILQNAQYGDEELVMVLEDDIQLADNFIDRVKQKLETIPPDWEIAFLSWFRLKPPPETAPAYTEDWLTLIDVLGTGCYVVKKQSIAKLLSVLLPVKNHIDKQMVNAVKEKGLKGYWLRERLVMLKPFRSQIAK